MNINKFYFRYVFVTIWTIVFTLTSLAQLTADPNNFSMKVGDQPKSITFKLADGTSATGVTCTINNSFDSTLLKIVGDATNSSIINLEANKATKTSIALNCSNGSQRGDIIITEIAPAVSSTNLTLAGSPTSLDKMILLKGQSLDLTVAKNVDLKKDTTHDFFSLTRKDADTWTITGNKPATDVKLVATNSGIDIPINNPLQDIPQGIPISVRELEIPTESLSIKKETKPISEYITIADGLVPTTGLKFTSSNPDLVEVIGTYPNLSLRGKAAASSINILISDGASFTKKLFVTVKTSPANLRISQNRTEVVVGEKINMSASILDDEGEPISGTIEWSLETGTDSEYVSVPTNGQAIEVLGLKVPPGKKPIRIVAKVKEDNTIIDRTVIFVRGERNVVGFHPIDVRIDMLDDRTAKDLFGGPASKEYHIAKIRIVNELDRDQNGGPASSVLFFSDALEVQVSLEKQAMKNGGNRWTALNREDIQYVNNWQTCDADRTLELKKEQTKLTGGQACALLEEEAKIECKRIYPDKNDSNKMRLCEIDAELEKLTCQQKVIQIAGNCGCDENDTNCLMRCKFCSINTAASNNTNYASGVNGLRSGQWIPFRPFVYQVVANTHDRRTGRSKRSRIFLGANMLGSALSFGTSFLVPKPGSDLPIFLEKYQNLLIPTAEKLFPSLREVERQNIVSLILPPIVEVPFGTDVSKYVFFPKKSIFGVLPENKVRITSISSYNVKVRVGIVQKETLQIP